MLQVTLFGATQVLTDGATTAASDMGGVKPRQILGILAASAGVPVPKDHIDSPAVEPEPVQLPEPPTMPLNPEKMVGGDVPADGQLSSQVMAKIVEDETLQGSNVKVEAKGKGVVNLSGTVTSARARERAVEIAKTTTGVREVEDQIKVDAKR